MLCLRISLAKFGFGSRLFLVGFLFSGVSLLVFASRSSAQQMRESRSSVKELADTPDKPFEDRFWKYLIGNNYKNWAPGPGQTGDFYTGQNPHGALLKMYLNRTAAGGTHDFPMGSVIILENYRADKSLRSISVMYRTKGFNPQGNDWYWIDYHPDGTVVKSLVAAGTNINNVSLGAGQLQKTMGRAANCMDCHQNGEGMDFVFFNDRVFDGQNPPGIELMADKKSFSESR